MELPNELKISDEDILNNCPPVEIPAAEIPYHLADEKGARLMISQVVCENFKSYGGRRILGPFHKNFTCIIGPNGSGKSNVIDALLFVFGFRASKVRSKKLSSLIHNSDELPNIEFCNVAVHFSRIIDTGQDAKDFEVVPGSEFIVSRKAFKDSSNSYYVNDCKASFKEVTGLLRQHGIDLDHNRFLILQGEVEQISLMKPKATTDYETGLLEYLEDIIGSNRFKRPLEILSERIERLKDIRLEKLARVKAVEKEKNQLSTVKDEALSYLRLLNKITSIKNVLFQKMQHQELANESRHRAQLVTIDAQLEDYNKQIKSLLDECNQLKSKRDTDDKCVHDLQEQYRASKARFANYEAEDSQIRDEHTHLMAQGKRTLKALVGEKKKLEELKKLPTEAEDRRNALKSQLDELEGNKAKQEAIYQETMDILAKETAPLRKKMEAAEAALAPVQKAADESASKLAIARQELELAMSAVRREQARAKEARDGVRVVQDRLAERERQLADALKVVGPQQIQDLRKAEADASKTGEEEGSLREQVNQLRSSLAEAKSTMQADTSRSRVLTALTTAMQAGRLTGILGRLGDLGTIPQKYDVAISTSCGVLDHIVVETMEQAQRAVEYLKQKNLGQASFIGLDKMHSCAKEASRPFTGPVPAAQRLFDLVDTSSNPNVRPCFYFALRNTLVAENMDVAVGWAFKHKQRHRVVTLEGQLIETSGAMSGGGGGRPICGRMTTDTQAAAARRRSANMAAVGNSETSSIAEKERKLADCESNLTVVRRRREQLEDAVGQMKQRIQEAQRSVTKCQNEISRLRVEASVLTKEADEAEKRAANAGPTAGEREKLEAFVTDLEKLNTTKAAKADTLRAKVEEVKSSLVNAGSARLAAVRSRVCIVEKKMKEVNDQFTKLEVDIKSAHRNETKCQAKITSYEEEVENLKSKLSTTEVRMREIEATAKVCMNEFQAMQKTIQELNVSISAVNNEIEGLESGLAEKRKNAGAVQRESDELHRSAKEAASRVRGWQAKLRSLRLHVIEEDEDDADESSLDPQIQPMDGVEGGDSSRPSVAVDQAQSKSRTTKLPTYSEEQLAEMTINESELESLETQTSAMSPNMAAIEQYRMKVNLYFQRVAELDQVTDLRAEQLRQEADAKAKRLSEFMTGFNVITTRLKEMYQMLTQGGDAELELIDSLDPFSEGIVFSVRPPKKTWKSIANLSGGEKTLSSLALVFALHHYKPTPLYVMDEIDAALDFKNVSIVGNYVVDRTKDAQFVIISLRNNMFELADRLVGIYKTHNITKSVALDCSCLSRQLENAIAKRIGTPVPIMLARTQPGQQAPPATVGVVITSEEQPAAETDAFNSRSSCSSHSAQTFVSQTAN